jgi:hypothetical protein
MTIDELKQTENYKFLLEKYGIVGIYIKEESWEKQWVYLLSNDYKVVIETNTFYGQFISKVIFPNGKYWHCSNGIKPKNYTECGFYDESLPEFCVNWIDKSNFHNLVKPRFPEINCDGWFSDYYKDKTILEKFDKRSIRENVYK